MFTSWMYPRIHNKSLLFNSLKFLSVSDRLHKIYDSHPKILIERQRREQLLIVYKLLPRKYLRGKMTMTLTKCILKQLDYFIYRIPIAPPISTFVQPPRELQHGFDFFSLHPRPMICFDKTCIVKHHILSRVEILQISHSYAVCNLCAIQQMYASQDQSNFLELFNIH